MNMFATMATMDPASSDASESGSEEEQEAPWGQHCDRSAAGGTDGKQRRRGHADAGTGNRCRGHLWEIRCWGH